MLNKETNSNNKTTESISLSAMFPGMFSMLHVFVLEEANAREERKKSRESQD